LLPGGTDEEQDHAGQDRLKQGIPTAAFAFRGYNVSNLGRTPELLAHASYGPTTASILSEASQTCSEVLGRPVERGTRRTSRQAFGLMVRRSSPTGHSLVGLEG
jgi:hypothetical protein